MSNPRSIIYKIKKSIDKYYDTYLKDCENLKNCIEFEDFETTNEITLQYSKNAITELTHHKNRSKYLLLRQQDYFIKIKNLLIDKGFGFCIDDINLEINLTNI